MAKMNVRIAGTRSGGPPIIERHAVKASEAFLTGEWVRITTGDTIAVAGAAGATGVFGVAMEDAKYETGHPLAGTTKSYVNVALLDLNTIFSAPIVTGALGSGEVHTNFEIDGGTGVSTTVGVDCTATTNACVTVLGPDPADSTRVLCVGFAPDSLAAAGDSAQGSQAVGVNNLRAA